MLVCRLAHLAGHIEIARDKLEGSGLFVGLYIGQALLSECRNPAKGPEATSLTTAMSGRFHGQFSYAARSIRMLADFLNRHPEALVRGRTNEGAR